MFLGRYEHTIDEKGRITIPVRYREELADGGYVCQGMDQNLMVLKSSLFDHLVSQLEVLSVTDPNTRQLQRLLFSTAEHLTFDRSGRMLLPDFLREVAQLQLEGGAVLVGVGNYFEIWSPGLWVQQKEELQDGNITRQRFAPLNLSMR